MDYIWIKYFVYGILLLTHSTSGQSDLKVELVVKKYIDKGGVAKLLCQHNVPLKKLYKVTWRKSGLNKFFEFINGRNPPFRNYTIPGCELDLNNSNEEYVTLRNLDFEASGQYYCEVSTDAPIFTKASNEEQIHVILAQTGPPRINFSKRQFFVGENLRANCTTSKARPAPHITWLINGKKVEEKHIKSLHPYAAGGKTIHRSKSHQLNNPSYKLEPSQPGVPLYIDGSGGFEKHHSSTGYSFDNPDSTVRETQADIIDNKHFDTIKKHRLNRNGNKYRRHVSEGGLRSSHRAMISSSQLSIEVSDLHADSNGRLEITCLATIPAHVGPGEEFADYKTFSLKIDVEAPESTSLMPSASGRAATSTNSTSTAAAAAFVQRNKCISVTLLLCLPIIMLFFV